MAATLSKKSTAVEILECGIRSIRFTMRSGATARGQHRPAELFPRQGAIRFDHQLGRLTQ
jgi:hypothetical protein